MFVQGRVSMTQLHRFKFLFISTALLLLMALIGGCAPKATPTRVAEEQPESPWVDVKVIPSGEPLVRVVQTEKIAQPNCGGTLEVENVVQRSRTIIHTVELGGGVEVNARGEVGLLGTGVEVGAAIAAHYGQTYGTEDTLTRAITVKAKQGTNMEHTIQQVEIWQLGTAEITISDQQFTYPYQFSNDFSVELVKSQNIGCPPTEGVPSTPTATRTNTLTPEPALPTDTPTPKLATPTDTLTPRPAPTDTPTPEPIPTQVLTPVPSPLPPTPTPTSESLVAKPTIGAGDITQYRTWRPDKVIEVGGTIDKDTVWTVGNLYVIKQDLFVPEGIVLTIQSGVVIKVSGRGPGKGDYYASAESLEQRNLFVAGTLLAEGTEEQPIIFTSLQDDTIAGDTNGDASNSSPAPGNWGRIEMSTGSDASVLRHVEIRYGGAQAIRNSDGVQSHAVLSLRGASPTIQNVTLTQNYEKGIWVDQQSRATITNSRIEDNGGAGIWVSEGSSPSITNNVIARNQSWAIGAHPEWLPQLQGNRLLGNSFNGLGLYSGQIAESSNWYLTEHPIGILADITVVDGAQLTIQPGVVIKVSGRGPGEGDYYASAESLEQRNLFVAGTLLAEGTEEQPIIFTSLQDDTIAGDTNGDASNSSPAPGNWGRIEMSTGSDASVLRHVEIRYGGAQAIRNSDGVQSHAVLSLKGPSPLLDSVVILEAYDVQLSCESGASPKIVNSQFVATNCE
jgi:parallel beta-helix repeat protein